jgi:Tol biopolymer transport system component
MNQLWPDSFVEENNLAVTIRQLRKTLADDAHNPIYIETVARQGYRFVAEVVRESTAADSEIAEPQSRAFRYLVPLAAVGALLIVSISLGSRYLAGRSVEAPILNAPFAAQKLSTSGNVRAAAISPDGERVVYTVQGMGGESVWLRENASGNNVEIIPASDEKYYRVAFSPDGSTLYYTRGPRAYGDPADIYRTSIFGGVPTKIISDTRGWISVSPDGSLISFVRCRLRDNEYCSLWTADSLDGKNERMLTTKPRPIRIGDNKIAPDGRSIIFAVGQSENASTDFGLSSIDLETGNEQEISTEKFFDIRSLEVLPDKSGALITASRGSTQRVQVWKIGFADGKARPLTKDSESYLSISIDASGSRMVATQVSNNFHLARTSLAQAQRKETLTEPAWAFSSDSDGGIVFQSDSTGDLEIWLMDRDGKSRRQLTNVAGDDTHPVVSSGRDEVYFCSNRSGRMQVWRMNADGSNQTQVTNVHGGFPLFATVDWVYYQHEVDRTLWRVSRDSGAEEIVLNRAPSRGPFVFSSSGRQAAFIEIRKSKPHMVIVSIPSAHELRSTPLVDGTGRVELAWLPDESAVAYTMSGDRTNAVWIQPVNGDPPRQSANLDGDPILCLSFPSDADSVTFVQGRWKHDFAMLTGLQ